ncbi:uncharacterized protein BJ171DRAFT_512805 [Polychytrium aggregatum]|uniref:uncharacterized protein n=1 Tax=Polychytrium aggregatum TaxID=110093 RepID=UPI0022FEC4C8|nr:uncharacterized protein BJ171DRAFT_512805 [Polychytrium aggregatum]KAI9202644.1 hypothetical protein BJ171DRAFT_512805 [Polychytrium aggregatum]
MSSDSRLAELQSKWEVENKIREGAEQMLKKITDRNASEVCESNLLESQRRLSYLENEMKKLGTKANPSQSGDHINSPLDSSAPSNLAESNPASPKAGAPYRRHSFSANTSLATTPMMARGGGGGGSVFGQFISNAFGRKHTVSHSASRISSHESLSTLALKFNSAYLPTKLTNFDYLRCDIPITTQKVKYKLTEVEYKLERERNVKAGTEKMNQVVSQDPNADPKRQQQVQEKLIEATSKVNLLQKSSQRYRGLYVADETDSPISRFSTANRPKREKELFSGRIKMRLVAATNLEGRQSHKTDTCAIIRIDGQQKAQTRQSPSRWNDEFDIPLSKNHEIEISICEKSGLVLGLVWFKMSELNEQLCEIYKQQKGAASGPPQPPALSITQSMPQSQSPPQKHSQPQTPPRSPPQVEQRPGVDSQSSTATVIANSTGSIDPTQLAQIEIETWLEIEPAGQLLIKLSYDPIVDSAKQKRKNKRAKQLERRAPVQKFLRKRGHKFVNMQFYKVLKCAVCSEFLISGGLQCQACRYTCHTRCSGRVVTKCITTLNEDADAAENESGTVDQLLKHRIPHRFEATTSISLDWCCHCGFMLPIGRSRLVCTECGIASHQDCQHLVPNFCGLTPELIDQMKSAIDLAERRKREKLAIDQEKAAIAAAKAEALTKEQEQAQSVKEAEEALVKQQQRQEEEEKEKQQKQQQELQRLRELQEQQKLEQEQQKLEQEQLQKQQQLQLQQQQQQLQLQQQQQLQQQLLQQSQEKRQSLVALASQIAAQPQSPVIQPGEPRTHPDAPRARPHSKHATRKTKPIGLDDFNFLAVLGKGNFGKVMLAEEKATQSLFAIKVLKKEFIIENDEVESTRSEKRVFLTANMERHPFLVNLHSCFQTESRIYFVMEYISGGDLMWHIQHQPFSEARAKFYACEVLLALEYFHRHNIVYRDLKLDNILLSLDGHVKITDYGLCKEHMPYGATTNTFCGTPEFMAPEILQEKPYGRAVDWWALGVLIYEMILGQSPFRGDDEDEIFEAILEDEIMYPANMNRDAVSLLQKLLMKDPSKRLGCGRTDSEEIKKHPYFKGVDFDAMLQLKLPPPFYPSIGSPTDVSNFDEEFTKEMPVLTPCTSVLSATDQEEFRGFTYISEWAQETRARIVQAAATAI